MKIGTGIFLEKFMEDPSFYKDSFHYLEVQDFVMPSNLDSFKDEVLEKYAALLRDFRGNISLHGPYIDLKATSFDPLVQDVFLRRARQILDVAKRLKSPYVVFHSEYERKSYSQKDYNEFFLAQSISVWKILIKDFEKAKVTALIENVHNPDGSIIKAIIDEIDNPYLGACLDIGHAHAFGRVPLEDWIRCHGPSLKYIHLSDNNGKKDEHLPLGEGNIPFSSFLEELKKTDSLPILILEVFGDTETEKLNLEYLSKLK